MPATSCRGIVLLLNFSARPPWKFASAVTSRRRGGSYVWLQSRWLEGYALRYRRAALGAYSRVTATLITSDTSVRSSLSRDRSFLRRDVGKTVGTLVFLILENYIAASTPMLYCNERAVPHTDGRINKFAANHGWGLRSERGDFSCKSPSAARPDKGSIKRTAFLPLSLSLPSPTPSTPSFMSLFLPPSSSSPFSLHLSLVRARYRVHSLSRDVGLSVLLSPASLPSYHAPCKEDTSLLFLDITPSACHLSTPLLIIIQTSTTRWCWKS